MNKKYAIIAGASALVLTLGLMTGCSQKKEEVVEEEPIVEEETLVETAPEVEIEDEIVIEEPVEGENEEVVEDPEAELPAEQTILVAELTEIAEDGSMTILPYELADETADAAIEDFANVDFSAYLAGEEGEALVLAEDAVFQLAQDGELVEADASSLTVGSMLIVITDAEGNQSIVIYNPVADEAA